MCQKVLLFKWLLLDLLISIHPLSPRLSTPALANLITSSADSHKASNSPATAPLIDMLLPTIAFTAQRQI